MYPNITVPLDIFGILTCSTLEDSQLLHEIEFISH